MAIKSEHSGKIYDIKVGFESTGIVLNEIIVKFSHLSTDNQEIILRGGPLKNAVIRSTLSLRVIHMITAFRTPLIVVSNKG